MLCDTLGDDREQATYYLSNRGEDDKKGQVCARTAELC